MNARAGRILAATFATMSLGIFGSLAVGASTGASSNRSVSADKVRLKFDKASLAAPTGSVTLTLVNPSPAKHTMAVRGGSLKFAVVGKPAGKGGKSVVTAKLKAGRYVFFCQQPGHETAGMRGTLIVR